MSGRIRNTAAITSHEIREGVVFWKCMRLYSRGVGVTVSFVPDVVRELDGAASTGRGTGAVRSEYCDEAIVNAHRAGLKDAIGIGPVDGLHTRRQGGVGWHERAICHVRGEGHALSELLPRSLGDIHAKARNAYRRFLSCADDGRRPRRRLGVVHIDSSRGLRRWDEYGDGKHDDNAPAPGCLRREPH